MYLLVFSWPLCLPKLVRPPVFFSWPVRENVVWRVRHASMQFFRFISFSMGERLVIFRRLAFLTNTSLNYMAFFVLGRSFATAGFFLNRTKTAVQVYNFFWKCASVFGLIRSRLNCCRMKKGRLGIAQASSSIPVRSNKHFPSGPQAHVQHPFLVDPRRRVQKIWWRRDMRVQAHELFYLLKLLKLNIWSVKTLQFGA